MGNNTLCKKNYPETCSECTNKSIQISELAWLQLVSVSETKIHVTTFNKLARYIQPCDLVYFNTSNKIKKRQFHVCFQQPLAS